MNYKNIILLCIILLILLYIFITNNLSKYKPDYIFVVISILILSIIFIQLQKYTLEKFENTNTSNTTNTTNTTNTAELISIENENLNEIQNNLLVYLTSYSNKSYNNGTIWNNIAPNKISDKTDTNTFIFLNEPILTSTRELKLQSNILKGPFSMNLGIDMKQDFTIFINIKLSSFNSTQNLFKIFELYATKDNIGLYAHIIKDDNNDTFIKLSSAFSSDIFYKISNNNFSLFDNQYHLITIVKNSEFLKLYIDNYLDNNFNLPAQTEVLVFDNKFSNAISNILDNTTNNIINYITHFGIYNKALTINNGIHEVTVLYDYIKKIMLKQSSTYSNLLLEYNSLKDSIILSKNNPFNSESINKKCSMITDWSKFDNIIINADDNCLKSINDYCQTDQNFEQCKIWNSFQKLVPFFTIKKNSVDLIDIPLYTTNNSNNSNNTVKNTTNNNIDNTNEINITQEEKKNILNNTYLTLNKKETFINNNEKYNKILHLYNLDYKNN